MTVYYTSLATLQEQNIYMILYIYNMYKYIGLLHYYYYINYKMMVLIIMIYNFSILALYVLFNYTVLYIITNTYYL